MWDFPAYSIMEYKDILSRSIRKNNWHYVEYDGGKRGTMLFDISKDPHELKNLAADPKYAKTIAELSALLKKMPEK